MFKSKYHAPTCSHSGNQGNIIRNQEVGYEHIVFVVWGDEKACPKKDKLKKLSGYE